MRDSESLVTVAGLVICAIVLCLGGIDTCVPTDKRKADGERNARAFATMAHLDVQSVVCSGADSTNDGYTSCTLILTDGTMRAIECGYDRNVAIMGQNTGCKMALPGNVVQQ